MDIVIDYLHFFPLGHKDLIEYWYPPAFLPSLNSCPFPHRSKTPSMLAFRPGNLSPSLPICKEMPCHAASTSRTVLESIPPLHCHSAEYQGSTWTPPPRGALPHPTRVGTQRPQQPCEQHNSDNIALLLKNPDGLYSTP